MNGCRQSDRFVVPASPLNNAAAAEAGEGKGADHGEHGRWRPGRSAGPGVSSGLDRVREVARRDKEARFTALLHHVSEHRLMLAFDGLKKDAAPGVDGVTWRDCDRDWQGNLRDLHGRVRSGHYRAVPSRRVYIPKADGRLRPPGVASLEDKIVQRALAEVLNAVYEIKERLHWPDNRDGTLWGVAAERAYEERQEIIERVTRELAALRDAGKLIGRPPFGYVSAGEKYDHYLAPTDDGRKYVPLIFQHCIEGWSLNTIVEWLNDEGIASSRCGKWWAKTVGDIIKNPAYMGHRASEKPSPRTR